jgi:hypothetical protein
MRNASARSALALLMVLIGGCVTTGGQMERTAAFTSASETALFVFGVDVQSAFKSPSLVFMRYDPATGLAIARSARHVMPRQDHLSTGERFGAAMTGQQSLPTGRSLFVIELPAGNWVLWCVSGYASNGVVSYSSVSYLSRGTLALHAVPGKASYIGEYEINGDIADNLGLVELPRRFDKSRSELASFGNVQVELESVRPEVRKFSCEPRTVLLSKVECAQETVTVLPLEST